MKFIKLVLFGICFGTSVVANAGTMNCSSVGEFLPEKPNDKGLVICKTLAPDVNVQEIVGHRVLGLMFRLSGQAHAVMFNCTKP